MLNRKLENALWIVLGAVAALYKLRIEFFLASILSLLTVVGLIAALKNDNLSLWIFPLLFGGCAFVLTYRLLGHLGHLKRRS